MQNVKSLKRQSSSTSRAKHAHMHLETYNNSYVSSGKQDAGNAGGFKKQNPKGF